MLRHPLTQTLAPRAYEKLKDQVREIMDDLRNGRIKSRDPLPTWGIPPDPICQGHKKNT